MSVAYRTRLEYHRQLKQTNKQTRTSIRYFPSDWLSAATGDIR
jgi:hypothetical protein